MTSWRKKITVPLSSFAAARIDAVCLVLFGYLFSSLREISTGFS